MAKNTNKAGPVFRKASIGTRLQDSLLFLDENEMMWVSGVLYFNKDIGVEEIQKLIEEKLKPIPRFVSCYDIKKRGWSEIEDGNLDLSYHLIHVQDQVSADDIESELKRPFQRNSFDVTKPLWYLTYFSNYESGKGALILTVNHIVGDGISLVGLVFEVIDPIETEDKKQEKVMPRRKIKSPYGPLNKAGIAVGSCFKAVAATNPVFDEPNPLFRKEITTPSSERSISFAEPIELAKVKEVKNKFKDATINDILFAVLNMAIVKYIKEKDPKFKKKRVRAGFLINMRPKGASLFRDGSPHNQIGQGFLRLRFKYKTRQRLVYEIKRDIDKIKVSPFPYIQQWFTKKAEPFFARAKAAKLFKEFLVQPTATLSNVPGPQNKVTLGGHEIEDIQFSLFTPAGLYIGLISYNGSVGCSVCLDEKLGDAKEISKYWNEEFNLFYEEVMKVEGAVPPLKKFTDIFKKI
eukprot:augustus_masked-scaffold_6-processed-gene-18.66-mRNA-1 protein AED:1.00 eAED:1.00 QI:0/-1/0/0/-1/1/1/0/462